MNSFLQVLENSIQQWVQMFALNQVYLNPSIWHF